MVLFLLYLKADLENVEAVSLKSDANICINVRNPLSDYEVRDKVVLNLTETVEQEEGAREPPHHFALKWDGQKKASTLVVIQDEAAAKTALKKKKGVEKPRKYGTDDSGNWSPILLVECRGMEPYAFFAMGNDFVVTTTGGKTFAEDVDLSEGDWAEYDEENDGKLMRTMMCTYLVYF